MATSPRENFTDATRMGALVTEPSPRAALQSGKVMVDASPADTKEKNSGGGHNDPGGRGGSMSLDEFHVALGELRRAIGVVRGESEHISGLIGQVESHFEAARTSWQTPSASSFETMSNWFSRASRELENLLREMASRMQVAYDNYAAAEHANTHNSGG
ncbi:WXG100 family type VII secretion target (plasmid) [Streptomyces sp. HUAS TT11]|uniref:WXG100 family type VII secretion target n=1 Tax=Streptomyces sp. HUAS TT11 TaxID=3447508 RepID=UPI003F659089